MENGFLCVGTPIVFEAGGGLLTAAEATGKIDDVIGLLAGKCRKVATLDEIKEAAAPERW